MIYWKTMPGGRIQDKRGKTSGNEEETTGLGTRSRCERDKTEDPLKPTFTVQTAQNDDSSEVYLLHWQPTKLVNK